MAHKASEDETILRVTAALPVLLIVGFAGLALVGSLADVVSLPTGVQEAMSNAVLVVAVVVAGLRARRG